MFVYARGAIERDGASLSKIPRATTFQFAKISPVTLELLLGPDPIPFSGVIFLPLHLQPVLLRAPLICLRLEFGL